MSNRLVLTARGSAEPHIRAVVGSSGAGIGQGQEDARVGQGQQKPGIGRQRQDVRAG